MGLTDALRPASSGPSPKFKRQYTRFVRVLVLVPVLKSQDLQNGVREDVRDTNVDS